jgi:hypothetical protein
MTIYYITMKQKLFLLLQKISEILVFFCNVKFINLALLIILGLLSFNIYKETNSIIFNKKYVNNVKPFRQIIAKPEFEDDFALLINKNNLEINNSEAIYSAPDENTKDVTVTYKFALEGSYLNFLNYLKLLQENKLLNKIEQLSLAIKSSEKIDINLQMECIYDK